MVEKISIHSPNWVKVQKTLTRGQDLEEWGKVESSRSRKATRRKLLQRHPVDLKTKKHEGLTHTCLQRRIHREAPGGGNSVGFYLGGAKTAPKDKRAEGQPQLWGLPLLGCGAEVSGGKTTKNRRKNVGFQTAQVCGKNREKSNDAKIRCKKRTFVGEPKK